MSGTGNSLRLSKDDEDDNFFEDYACFMSTSPEEPIGTKGEPTSESARIATEAGSSHVSAEFARVLCEIDEVLNDDADKEKVNSSTC